MRDRPSFDDQFSESESERNARLRSKRLLTYKTAKNCSNWSDGCCQTCGVPWQYFEVNGEHHCKSFSPRTPAVKATP